MSADTAYLDTSAFVKLLVREKESAALRRHLRQRRVLTSAAVIRTEAIRAVTRAAPELAASVDAWLRRLALIDIDRPLLDRAAQVLPTSVRTLDAIHLAAAMALGSDLAELVTYDARMAAAATVNGLDVTSPS